jgi:ribonuclease D
MRRNADLWWQALSAVAAMADSDLPGSNGPGNGLPPVNRWADRDPDAATRLSQARAALGQIAEAHNLPVENLLEPALVRRLAWAPPSPLDLEGVRSALAEGSARPWQIRLTAEALAVALATSPE